MCCIRNSDSPYGLHSITPSIDLIMPRRAAVYRSFVACYDPKGVADCKTRRVPKSKIQDTEVEELSNCIYDELREVIRENFARQSLKGVYCGHRKDFDLLPSSGSSIRAASSECNSLSEELRAEKPKAGNLIAKLMGLDEVVLAREKLSSNQRSQLLDIGLLARPPSVVHKVVGERLRKQDETMQFKGVVFEREGKCQSDLSFLRKMLAVEGRPPIVVMRPRCVPHFHSTNEVNTIKRRQMPGGVREEFPLQVPKGRVMVTINNRKINKEKEGSVHFGESHKKDLVFRDKPSSKKVSHPKPLLPRVYKNEAVVKRIDDSHKLASNTRKQAGIKDAKTQNQGKTTTLKLIRKNTRDSSVSNCQNATTEKKTKPMLSLSSIPKKNLRKSKSEASVEGGLPINIESSITQDSMMNSRHVSKSDNSANAIDKNDMKCVEDGTCIPGRSVDDTKGWESIYNTRHFLLSSASFLSLVEELFDVGTCDTEILRATSLHGSEMHNGSLLLDCATEILERKSTLRCTWALNPSSQSFQQLIGEISDEIEVWTNYNKSCSGAVHADRIYSMLERDLLWNEEVTGAWDLGWRTGNTTEDVNRVVHDLEELVLREIIADVVIEFMFM